MTPLPSRLLFIADLDEAGENFFSILEAALKGGCRWVLLRGKGQDRKKLLAAGTKAKAACAAHGAKFFVGRDGAVAKTLKTDGLHLPAFAQPCKIPGLMLGQSCHNAAEMQRAADHGVDYVFLSPIFPTKTKPDYGPALGLDRLKTLAAQSPLPVCALGGITPANAASCLKAGAQAVAVMGGILHAADPQKQAQAYLQQLK